MWTHRDNKIESLDDMPEDTIGFVYLITNLTNNKKYIGRKYITSTRRKALTKKQKDAGRVRKTVVKAESNWKTYTGSNKQLNQDIDQLGLDQFKFEILAFGKTKGQVNLLEEITQIKLDCLFDDNYYNDAIGSRRFASVQITDFLKEQIKSI